MELIEKIALALEIKPYLLFYDDLDAKITKKQPVKKGKIPGSVKNELIKNLTTTIRKIKSL